MATDALRSVMVRATREIEVLADRCAVVAEIGKSANLATFPEHAAEHPAMKRRAAAAARGELRPFAQGEKTAEDLRRALAEHVRYLISRAPGFDERRVLAERRDGIPAPLLRDLDALADHLKRTPPELRHATQASVLTLYLRLAAVMFWAGYKDAGDDIVRAMGSVECAMMLARMCKHPAADEVFEVSGHVTVPFDSWLGCWFRVGCPRVRVTREEVAALALTDMPDLEVMDRAQAQAPWPHFMVELPEGALLALSGGRERSVDRIMMHRLTGPQEGFASGVWLTFFAMGAHVVSGTYLGEDTADAAKDDEAGAIFSRSDGGSVEPGEVRALCAAARVGIGACLALAEMKREGRIRARCAPPQRRGTLPLTTDVRLGLPVKVDFSEALADYTLGRKAVARKSQWVVRGHWREQACGKGWQEHRRIWVQPFWKGPAHLPILIRAHELVPKAGT